MAVYTDGNKTFTAQTAVKAYERVNLVAGSGKLVETAGAGEYAIGFADSAAAAGSHVSVDLLCTGETFKAIASGAISEGAQVYGAADGKVSATPTGVEPPFAIALQAASADGEVIEILPVAISTPAAYWSTSIQ